MALNGSYVTASSPTFSDGLHGPHHHLLSSSISSLSSSVSSARQSSSSHISKTYRQASTLFLTRRLPEALSTILPLLSSPASEDPRDAIEPAPVARASRTTRIKVWSLYLTILNAIVELDPTEGKDAFGTQEWRSLCSKVREGDVWEEVVKNGYHGVEGDVDADVVINLATLLLAHARTQILNQKRLEAYLAAAGTPKLDISDRFSQGSTPKVATRYRSPAKGTSGADTPRDLNARVKILELYTLHVLLRNDEWEYAREFISMSSVLDEERREAFLLALQSLQEEKQESEKRDREEQQRQEDQLRQEIEDSRRLREENEERERRRLEEERTKRGGSEVDYGVDRTPSVAGSSKGHHPSRSRSSIARPLPPTSKKANTVTPPSLATRASMAFSNIRILVEQMSYSLRSNPAALMRILAFIIGLILMFGRRSIRERILRILNTGWSKVRATAGMGVKVSYI